MFEFFRRKETTDAARERRIRAVAVEAFTPKKPEIMAAQMFGDFAELTQEELNWLVQVSVKMGEQLIIPMLSGPENTRDLLTVEDALQRPECFLRIKESMLGAAEGGIAHEAAHAIAAYVDSDGETCVSKYMSLDEFSIVEANLSDRALTQEYDASFFGLSSTYRQYEVDGYNGNRDKRIVPRVELFLTPEGLSRMVYQLARLLEQSSALISEGEPRYHPLYIEDRRKFLAEMYTGLVKYEAGNMTPDLAFRLFILFVADINKRYTLQMLQKVFGPSYTEFASMVIRMINDHAERYIAGDSYGKTVFMRIYKEHKTNPRVYFDIFREQAEGLLDI